MKLNFLPGIPESLIKLQKKNWHNRKTETMTFKDIFISPVSFLRNWLEVSGHNWVIFAAAEILSLFLKTRDWDGSNDAHYVNVMLKMIP